MIEVISLIEHFIFQNVIDDFFPYLVSQLPCENILFEIYYFYLLTMPYLCSNNFGHLCSSSIQHFLASPSSHPLFVFFILSVTCHVWVNPMDSSPFKTEHWLAGS